MMLFAAVAGASALTLWALVEAYNWAFGTEDKIEDATASNTYYTDAPWFEEPQVGIRYLIEDPDGVDASDTLDAVVEWIYDDEPNIITGKWQATVNTLADVAVVDIKGDASALLEDRYDDVEMPYVDKTGDVEYVKVDMDFA